MRRVLALVVVVVLVIGACSGDDEDAAPTTTASSVTMPDVPCDGIGDAPAAGEITWVQDGRVWASTGGDDLRCLVRADDASSLSWGGNADRAIVGDHTVVVGDGTREVGDRDELIGWSRPTGTSLLARRLDGSLRKHALDGSAPLELPLEGEALYHPSGVAIVTTVSAGDADQLLMSTNVGENQRWLVANESDARLGSLAFDGDGSLYFAADHGSHRHVHHLDLETNALSTVLESAEGVTLGPIAVSPFDSSLVAVARGDCEEAMWRQDDRTDAAGEPIGWLPDGRLVAMVHDEGCDGPGDVIVIDGDESTVVARGAEVAAVRAVLPPPPPPPPDIDQAAPA